MTMMTNAPKVGAAIPGKNVSSTWDNDPLAIAEELRKGQNLGVGTGRMT